MALEISCTEAEILEKLEKLKDDLETIFREALQRIVKSEIKREFRQIYQKKISQILIDIFACLEQPDRDFLIFRYSFHMEVQKIAEVQYSSLYRVEKMLFEAKLKLRNKMLEWMQENLGIVLDSEEEFINLAIQIGSTTISTLVQKIRNKAMMKKVATQKNNKIRLAIQKAELQVAWNESKKQSHIGEI